MAAKMSSVLVDERSTVVQPLTLFPRTVTIPERCTGGIQSRVTGLATLALATANLDVHLHRVHGGVHHALPRGGCVSQV